MISPPKMAKCKINLAVRITILRCIFLTFVKHHRINMLLSIVMMSLSAPSMLELTITTRLCPPRLERPSAGMNPPTVAMLLTAILHPPIFTGPSVVGIGPLMVKVMMTKISRPPMIMGPLVVWTGPPMVKVIITIMLRHPMITSPLVVAKPPVMVSVDPPMAEVMNPVIINPLVVWLSPSMNPIIMRQSIGIMMDPLIVVVKMGEM